MPTHQCTIDYIKALPQDKLWEYALKYLKLSETKRTLNRAYRQLDHVKNQRRRYYYVRNDIYHPSYHPDGRVEKRHKRPTADEEGDGGKKSDE